MNDPDAEVWTTSYRRPNPYDDPEQFTDCLCCGQVLCLLHDKHWSFCECPALHDDGEEVEEPNEADRD